MRQFWGAPVVGFGMRAFQQKLARLKVCLKGWNKEVFGNVFDRVKEAEKEVAWREGQYDLSGSADDRAAFSEARAQLQHALLCEEIFLRQQSSVRWVREGDANTRFFHVVIRKKHRFFLVHRIHDASSAWITEPTAMAELAIDYFQGLVAEGPSQFQLSDFDFIPSLVTAEDDMNLCREPDLEELR